MNAPAHKFKVYAYTPNAEDAHWMEVALQEAAAGAAQGEVPIGAVLVHEGRELARTHNAPIAQNNACAHAEILAIQSACKALGNYRLGAKATLYVTLQPCLMCLGAIAHARIGRVVLGSAQSRFNSNLEDALHLLSQSEALHPCSFEWGCMAEESEMLLKTFFKSRRTSRLQAITALKKLSDMPNVNKNTLQVLRSVSISEPSHLLARLETEEQATQLCADIKALAENAQAQGDAQQAAILASLCDYLQGEPVRSWKAYL
ncbi:nucleoside deaminase [Limnobacter sp.]|uniref:nucleoside deaminase n=1 Tax=Limnobacter sp. TaxID=2003368 RepID=UPI0035142EC1